MAEGEDDLQKALVDNFIAITGADVERASFFLQSAAWNLQVRRVCVCGLYLHAGLL